MILLLFAIAIGANYFEEDIKHIESVSVYFESPKINYQLATLEGENDLVADELHYQPVVSTFTGASVTTQYFTIGWSLQGQNEELEELEESRLFDLQFYGNYRKLMWEIYYQNYQGLYISNDEEIENTNLPTANSFS